MNRLSDIFEGVRFLFGLIWSADSSRESKSADPIQEEVSGGDRAILEQRLRDAINHRLSTTNGKENY